MAETIGPCPFCGGEAVIQRFGNQGLPFRIICSCGAEIRGGKGESVADGIERWNRRAERTCRAVEFIEEETFGTGLYFECSECHETIGTFSEYWSNLPNYCPHCGARVVSDDDR